MIRKVAFLAHLWTGLVLGLYFVLVSLTGALLVFGEAIDARLNPHLMQVQPRAERLPFSQILAAVRQAHPDAVIRFNIHVPTSPEGVYEFSLGERRAELRQLYVDPY